MRSESREKGPKEADSSLSSPRKRGYGQLGMTKSKDQSARLEAEPLQSRYRSEFFPQTSEFVPFHFVPIILKAGLNLENARARGA